MPVGMAFAPIAELIDRDVVADAGDDVLQDPAARRVKQHVVRDDRRHAPRRGEIGEIVEAKLVVRPPAQRERQIGAVAEQGGDMWWINRTDIRRFVMAWTAHVDIRKITDKDWFIDMLTRPA